MNDETLKPDSAVLQADSATARCWPAGLEVIARSLRDRHPVSDAFFDRFLPDHCRQRSPVFWTPVAIGLQVAAWLEREGVQSVVDLGAGCGKLCVVAALATKNTVFVGVEQRRRLVIAAESLGACFDLSSRVRFIHGRLDTNVIPKADAYYLFNPFEENLFHPGEPTLDNDVELSRRRFREDVYVLERFLAHAPLGTFVIKYYGFGGRMPTTYEPIDVFRDPPGALRLWRKTRM